LGAFASADVSSGFEGLSAQQQARVMQRCKDVMKNPGRADRNQIAICQTLSSMSKR
jgi:hypothetical protein